MGIYEIDYFFMICLLPICLRSSKRHVDYFFKLGLRVLPRNQETNKPGSFTF